MDTFDISADDIENRGAFNVALTRLIDAAEANNIGIRGGYRSDAEDGHQDYGIEIYRVSG